MSGEIRPRNTNRGMTRKCVCRRALAFLAITFAGFQRMLVAHRRRTLNVRNFPTRPMTGLS